MLDQEDIEQQRKLLIIHRRTLGHSLRQHRALGVLAPAGLVNGIHECWTNIRQIKLALRAISVEVIDEPDDEPRDLTIVVPTQSRYEPRNRSRMLQKVQEFWVEGVLENSLQGAALMGLGLEYKPDAVQHPWDTVIQQINQPTRAIPPETKLIEVFDDLGGELLILGAPGSGKTTMLLELARDLISRAEQNETYPIPVVFNLSSWAERRKPLTDWVVDELNTKYNIPQKIGKAWVDADQVLPLLDGLDEVKQEQRGACVEAINVFRQTHGLVNVVVCSRITDYEALTECLKLQNAVLVKPLTAEQIDAYLANFEDQFAVLRRALTEDAALRELAAAPLMLSIMTLAYQGVSADRVAAHLSVDKRGKWLFDTYVERMFLRRGVLARYKRVQTEAWLACLARGMIVQGQSLFFIEQLEPSWLQTNEHRRWYVFGVGMIGGLWVGVIGGIDQITTGFLACLAFGLGFQITGWLRWLAYSAVLMMTAVVAAWIGWGVWNDLGYLLGWITIAILAAIIRVRYFTRSDADSRKLQIAIVEQFAWSGQRAMRGMAFGIIGGLAIGLAAWAFGTAEQIGSLRVFLRGTLFWALIYGVIISLIRGLTFRKVGRRLAPNQGIWVSGRTAGIVIIVGAVLGLLLVSQGEGQIGTWVIALGLVIAFWLGGLTCIQHSTLRVILWRADIIPWNYVRFLDYCADRIFLRKVGGGYIFIHRMLMEYFASLDTAEQVARDSESQHSAQG